jgi:hypothetical protein
VWRVAVWYPAAPLWLERYRRQVTDAASLVAGRPVRVTFEVATEEMLAARRQEQDGERPAPAPDAEAPPCRRDVPRPSGPPSPAWNPYPA